MDDLGTNPHRDATVQGEKDFCANNMLTVTDQWFRFCD